VDPTSSFGDKMTQETKAFIGQARYFANSFIEKKVDPKIANLIISLIHIIEGQEKEIETLNNPQRNDYGMWESYKNNW